MMVVEHEAFTFLYLVLSSFSNLYDSLKRENRWKDNCKASISLKIIR